MRTLFLAGLTLGGMADAALVYTVTINTAPAFDMNVFTLSTASRQVIKPFSKTGRTVTFNVPAGGYNVGVEQSYRVPTQYSSNTISIHVARNMKVAVPVDLYPAMEQSGRMAFHRLLSRMAGPHIECGQRTVSDLCATVNLSVRNVMYHVSLIDTLTQIRPWQSVDGLRSAYFTVDARKYFMYIRPVSRFRSFIVFTRLSDWSF